MTSRMSRTVRRNVTGEVFTRREVVDHMIHEVAYFGRIRKWLGARVLEPSCGRGAFVLPLVEKVLAEVADWTDARLDSFLTACDISEDNIEATASRTKSVLLGRGCPSGRAEELVRTWFVRCDFLLHGFARNFDVVIGNPPYIRFDALAPQLQGEYKSRYKTFSARCDIYVPFFEKALSLLAADGVLSFICSNRFAKSSYGRRLRSLISREYRVALYLNMEHAQPFEEEVSAYPAICVLDRHVGERTLAKTIGDASRKTLRESRASRGNLSAFDSWYRDEAPWISTSRDRRDFAEWASRAFPVIEESAPGTRIGIGVASGADDLYVDAQRACDLEEGCLLPLVMAGDIADGVANWRGRYILNPYDNDDDRLMKDLADYPKMAGYLEAHAGRLKGRYCAKKHPDAWYRTLDRIRYRVLRSPKLLLPDIQAGGNVALDERGRLYPHHNVYWITSKGWDLRALCVLMRSSFVTNQMRCLSAEMRGGFIRYQAQNLRNVRIPHAKSLSMADVERLAALYGERGRAAVDAAVDAVVQRAAAQCVPDPAMKRREPFETPVQAVG